MRSALNWPHAPFHIPAEIYSDWTNGMLHGRDAHSAWRARKAKHPKSNQFDTWHAHAHPVPFPTLPRSNAPTPTIQSSGDMCDLLMDTVPNTLVLCADLEAPTNHKRRRHAFTATDRSGSYVHCGVREHLMSAMACGIAAHGGLQAIAVTYLAFSDYQRAAMRMAALMKLPVLFVFSHDSIGVGSNGPTHQPIETLASFRAMPNMRVFRPADAVETAEAWQTALETRDGPSVLALSRQPAEQLPPSTTVHRAGKGAYVASDASATRAVTLIATGTEVGLALQAKHQLDAQGIATAVVSLPCWEVFTQQPQDYQTETLGSVPRIAIEAASSFGWSQWLRPGDAFIGIDGFGASATADVLYDHFGITVENIVKKAKSITERP